MKKTLMLLGMMALTSLFAACNNNTTSPPSGAAPRTPRVSTPTSQPVSSPLVGSYTMTLTEQDLASTPEFRQTQVTAGGMDLLGTWLLKFRNDGDFMAINGVYFSGEQYIGAGLYTVTPNQLTIVKDAKCLEFYGTLADAAMYMWSLQGKTLTLKMADDLCPARIEVFTTHPWLKQGS